jgi:hypothetical protein
MLSEPIGQIMCKYLDNVNNMFDNVIMLQQCWYHVATMLLSCYSNVFYHVATMLLSGYNN